MNRSQVRLWLSTQFQNVMLPVWTQECLLACFAEERLLGSSLQNQCFNVHAFWKRLIGIFKMIYFVSRDFRMNIKSNICRIHPGMEVFQKDFSYHFRQLVIDALIIKCDNSQKKYVVWTSSKFVARLAMGRNKLKISKLCFEFF